MTCARALVRLYPSAVRERWGDELQQQVSEGGPRTWPNTVLGAAGLWARPALWPHTTAARTRRTVCTLAFAVIVLTTLVLRAAGGQAVALDPSSSVWFVLVMLGLLAATPIPLLRRSELAYVVITSVRTLAAPLLVLGAMVVAANIGAVHLDVAPDAVLVTYYWAALAFGGHRVCALVGRLAGATSTPSASRLRLALSLVGAGITLALCQLVTVMVRTQVHATGLLAAAALVGFVAVTASAARDLRTVTG